MWFLIFRQIKLYEDKATKSKEEFGRLVGRLLGICRRFDSRSLLVACEQAPHLTESREVTQSRTRKEPRVRGVRKERKACHARACVLLRFASLAIFGKLGRRLRSNREAIFS